MRKLRRNLLLALGGSTALLGGLRRTSLESTGLVLIGLGLMKRAVASQHLVISEEETEAAEQGYAWIGIHRSVTIRRPVDEVFHVWREYENLPYYMKHIKSVDISGTRRSHWVARAPAGLSVEWEAELVREEPNRLLVWRSLPGADIPNVGSVRFEPVREGRATRVDLSLRYRPPIGRAGTLLLRLFNREPSHYLESDLRRMKQMLETQQEPGQGESTAPPAPGVAGTAPFTPEYDEVEEASEESFPASDAPSWTPFSSIREQREGKGGHPGDDHQK